MIWALLQVEVSIYIVAQTIPLLRVWLLGDSTRDSKAPDSPAGQTAPNGVDQKTPAPGLDSIQEVRASIELVQLPSGKIVAADSEEGKALKSSQAGDKTGASAPTAEPVITQPQAVHGGRGVDLDDETHRIWADMGLSRRAWSKSPSPPPEGLRHQSMHPSGRA